MYVQMCDLFPGLHLRQGEVCQVPAPFIGALPGEALPQGPVPHCGAPGVQSHDAWAEQRQEADGCPHCQACL